MVIGRFSSSNKLYMRSRWWATLPFKGLTANIKTDSWCSSVFTDDKLIHGTFRVCPGCGQTKATVFILLQFLFNVVNLEASFFHDSTTTTHNPDRPDKPDISSSDQRTRTNGKNIIVRPGTDTIRGAYDWLCCAKKSVKKGLCRNGSVFVAISLSGWHKQTREQWRMTGAKTGNISLRLDLKKNVATHC